MGYITGVTWEDLFWSKVSKFGYDNNNCWIWEGPVDKDGYGEAGRRRKQSRVFNSTGENKSHRVSFFIHNGKIPKGQQVLHSCDIPACVNPRHLWLGTNVDNHHDKKIKGRARTARGSSQPHSKLTESNVKKIREMILDKYPSKAEISRIFNVSDSLIHRISSKKAWGWLV